MGEFDPFLDYSSITDEMTTDMCGSLREIEAAKLELMASPSPQGVERVLKAHLAIDGTIQAIQQAIYRLPVMVHVAGPVEDEDSEEHGEIKVQRCVRCKSQLAGWRAGLFFGGREMTVEEMTWHDEGEIIAKSGSSNAMPILYTVPPDRTLESFERECVGLPNMEDPS